MSTLSSLSTFEQIIAAYADNASYAEDGSAAKCKAFITACRLLILKLPGRVKQGGRNEIEMDVGLISRELAEAKRWLAMNAGTGGVVHSSMEGFRD